MIIFSVQIHLGGEMQVNNGLKDLLMEIDFCRKEMYGLLSSDFKTPEQVLNVSRKLDKLIVSYYSTNENITE